MVFTGYEDKSDLKSVKEMGGFVTASASDAAADVLVTDRVRRTAKFMCAMARGMPVVGPAWIAQSRMTKTFLGELLQITIFDVCANSGPMIVLRIFQGLHKCFYLGIFKFLGDHF